MVFETCNDYEISLCTLLKERHFLIKRKFVILIGLFVMMKMIVTDVLHLQLGFNKSSCYPIHNLPLLSFLVKNDFVHV